MHINKPILSRIVFVVLLSHVLVACATNKLAESEPKSLADTSTNAFPIRLATWNVEHLAFPADTGCNPRTGSQLDALRDYAEGLEADIIGLQEVASKEAVNQLFPSSDWTIVMSERADNEPFTCRDNGNPSTQQKVAFVVRKPLSVKHMRSLEQFGLGMPGLRFGLEITVASAEQELTLLNLHMKSGCFVDQYSTSDKQACQIFAQQAPMLESWVDEQERSGRPYAVLGDFNHRLSAPFNQLTRALKQNEEGNRNSLMNADAKLIGCHPYYPAPIDHILLGNMNTDAWQVSTEAVYFNDMGVDAMLSDHCAIVATVQQRQLPLTNSVKWQTQSKEYRALARSTYQRATQVLADMTLPDSPWVVVMDIDETVLDNSAYQVGLDQRGGTYSSETWAQWLKSEKATLTPGVAGFMQAVLERGGKIALITNRNAKLDEYTWRNMQALGLPVTFDNTCLLGRNKRDISAIDHKRIINDKDLRRIQVSEGDAQCFSTGSVPGHWRNKHAIVMQVGDNIEDFTHVTQHDADIDSLLPQLNNTYFLLPNPMYGSW